MQISRLFEIVYILLHRRHVTARELAERFEVSVRTIYRDVEALSMAGVPVYATQGAGGGISISEQYVLNRSTLTDAEQSQILLALKSLSATGDMDSSGLLTRLGSLFHKDSTDWVEVDFSRWGSTAFDRMTLAAIKDGILGAHPIQFTYYGGNGRQTERTAYPIKLVYKSQAWYVQAYCVLRKDFRVFKLVRMANVQVLDETFDRDTLGDVPPLESEEPSPPENLLALDLRFTPRVAWRVMDEFNPALIQHNDDGTLQVRVYFPDDDWLTGYLLSFGDGCEVLAPDSMRTRLRGIANHLLVQYQEP